MTKTMALILFAVLSLNSDAATYYVDAARLDDGGDGASWAAAKRTIQAAVNLTVDGDTVLVTNGVYSEGVAVTPGYSLNNRVALTNRITLRSVNGAARTVIEGSGSGAYATPSAVRCVFMSRGVLDGFTLRGGATQTHVGYDDPFDKIGGGVCMREAEAGTEVRNCVIRDCRAYDGGGAHSGVLKNCLVFGNAAIYGGGAYRSAVCGGTFSKNSATSDGGGLFYCDATNTISYGNTLSMSPQNFRMGTCAYCCTSPLAEGTGNVSADPLFADAENGDFRLQTASPCRDAGCNGYVAESADLAGNPRILNGTVDMGAYEFTRTVSVVFDAAGGSVSPTNKVVYFGETYGLLPTAVRGGYLFGGWQASTNGVTFAVDPNTVVTVSEDHTLSAVWTVNSHQPATYYVDAARPDDGGDGASWAAAKRTIQAAVDLTADGDTVLVTNGVYSEGVAVTPGYSLNNRVALTNRITLRSVNGAGATVIEGSGSGAYATPSAVRCVFMSRGVLDGFTLRGGATQTHVGYDDPFDKIGGGVCMREAEAGTEVRNCVIRDCRAYDGGGAHSGVLKNCLVLANAAIYGGGAYRSAVCGGTFSKNSAASDGGGLFYCDATNTISYGNTLDFNGQQNFRMGTCAYCCTSPLAEGPGNVSADPLFADAENGDFRLLSASPCRDAGSNGYVAEPADLAGSPRILNGTVDMGAYEFTRTVSVAFDAAGGSASPTNKEVYLGGKYGSLPVAVRSGYTFEGWQANTNGVTFAVDSNTVVTVSEDHTLSAVWTANRYEVTFDAGGGSVSPTNKTVVFGDAYGDLPVPTKCPSLHAASIFTGWFALSGLTNIEISAATVVGTASDHTLYAKWMVETNSCGDAADTALATKGQYAGYFYGEVPFAETNVPAIRGAFALIVTRAKGGLVAKASLQSGPVNFSSKAWGSTNADGTCCVDLVARSGETLALSVRQNRIWGTLSGGSVGAVVYTLEGARNRFSDRSDGEARGYLSRFSGYYTVALPPFAVDSTGDAHVGVEGSGYLTLSVDKGGGVKIAGALADGTSFSQSTALLLFDGCGPDACAPLFVPLYQRQGAVGGLLWFSPSGDVAVLTDRYANWFVRWEKPARSPDGVSVLMDAVGGYYSSVSALAAQYTLTAQTNSVTYAYSGGSADLQTAALPNGVVITRSGSRLVIAPSTRPIRLPGGAYDYSGENSARATFFFNPRSGVFKGHFNLYYDYALNGASKHKTVRVPYAGVLTPIRAEDFSEEPAGQGYYLVPDNDSLLPAGDILRSYRMAIGLEP